MAAFMIFASIIVLCYAKIIFYALVKPLYPNLQNIKLDNKSLI